MIASDDANREFEGARNPDSVLHVTFFVKSIKNEWLSEREAKFVFQDEEWIMIMIPGRNDLTISTPADASHKARFPLHWAHFKNMTADAEAVVGTPVTEWPIITRAQAENLRGNKFYTVEQIANCSDSQIQTLGMNASHLRQKAIVFLQSAKGNAIVQQQADEIAKRDAENAALLAQHAALAEQVAQLTAMIQAAPKKEKKEPKPVKPKRVMSDEARQAARERMAKWHSAKKAAAEQVPVNG